MRNKGAELERQVAEVLLARSRIAVADLLNPVGEKEWIQQATDEALVQAINQEMNEEEAQVEGEAEDEIKLIPLPSRNKQLEALVMDKRMADAAGEVDQDLLLRA